MLRSMTGYGKSTGSCPDYEVSVEIKSVNHRFLDLNFRMPAILNELELKLRELIKTKIDRGSVTVFVSLIPARGSKIKRIDLETAKAYKEALETLTKDLGINNEIGLDTLLRFPEIFDVKESSLSGETEDEVTRCFTEAVESMIDYRVKEGANIYEDMMKKAGELKEIVSRTNELSKGAAKAQYEKLLGRLKSMTDLESLNKERLEQELVLISDKVDISEEVTRLFSHIDLFTGTLEAEDAPGKILNNLAQEMHREASTISAKTNLTDISHLSVKMKDIIETIREQVQNAE
ncbi:MAG: YicC/YloC family endoribonuclease [Candidatus Delongbacteria bacterium]|nr:YicC/YloC family endoribonuclease [Candidatus Delongbacteria bacterium]